MAALKKAAEIGLQPTAAGATIWYRRG